MILKNLITCIIVAIALVGCSNSYDLEKEEGIIKVYVNDDNQIFSNGIGVSASEFEDQAQELAKNNGEIYYCRESKTTKDSYRSLETMDIILKYDLPVTYYKDKMFKEEGYAFPEIVD